MGVKLREKVGSRSDLRLLENIPIGRVVSTDSSGSNNGSIGNTYVRVADVGQIDDDDTIVIGNDGSVWEALSTVTSTQIGLENVDNTSDINKPISSATQTALDGKSGTEGIINSGASILLDQGGVGRSYNWSSASSATTYTTTSPVTNGYARCLINTTSEPTVTGATKRAGATWVTGTDMEMIVESPDGTNVYYYFLEL